MKSLILGFFKNYDDLRRFLFFSLLSDVKVVHFECKTVEIIERSS